MPESTVSFQPLAAMSKDILRQFLTMGENRVQLLAVEVQQERERLVMVILLAFTIAAFAVLAGTTLTAAMVIALWDHSPAVILLALTFLYAIGGIYFYQRMTRLIREWQTLSASLDQFRKDTQCLAKLAA